MKTGWKYSIHFGWAPQQSPIPAAKNNTKVCVCLNCPAMVYFSLSKAVDPFHTLFLSSRWLRMNDSSKETFVSVNQQMVFWVYITFPHCVVTTGVWLELKVQCHTNRLYRMVVLHVSMWCCSTKNVYLRILEVLFTNPSARAGYDTRSIFKRSLTGLNSEFSFS